MVERSPPACCRGAWIEGRRIGARGSLLFCPCSGCRACLHTPREDDISLSQESDGQGLSQSALRRRSSIFVKRHQDSLRGGLSPGLCQERQHSFAFAATAKDCQAIEHDCRGRGSCISDVAPVSCPNNFAVVGIRIALLVMCGLPVLVWSASGQSPSASQVNGHILLAACQAAASPRTSCACLCTS